MFYDGDLQSAIATAIQQSKLVLCFVRDDEAESTLWEDDFLRDESISSLLADKAISLRMMTGSVEAGYLAAIFPIPKTPTLVIIQKDQLKEYITTGTSKEEFLRRVKAVLDSDGGSQAAPSQSPATTSSAEQTTPSGASGAAHGPSFPVQNLLADRRARLEADRARKEAAEKADRTAKAKARREALEKAAETDPKKAADLKYAQLQKKRQQEAKDERARILKRVEDDKKERREKEAERKRQALGAKAEETVQGAKSPISRTHTECALQVRLFDGSTIRSRFPPEATLRNEVRRWVDEKCGNEVAPYNFKQVLTPLPNKTIEISEEEQTVQSIGLTPNATLILVPIKGYTSAYENQGVVSRGLGLLSCVTGAIGGVLGGGGKNQAAEGAPAASSSERTAPVTREEPRRPDDHQLYNGNALNFEPRPDDTHQD